MKTKPYTDLFARVREKRPLVHHITNYVTVNDCANITLCAGGAPVMADAPEEAAEMAAIASSLVLNIGTLSAAQIESITFGTDAMLEFARQRRADFDFRNTGSRNLACQIVINHIVALGNDLAGRWIDDALGQHAAIKPAG